MAGFDYVRSRATATRLLSKFGKPQELTLRQMVKSGSSYNPVITPTNRPGQIGVVLNYKTKDVDGTKILMEDKKVLLAYDPNATPALGDQLLIGGVPHEIINADPLSPGGVVVFRTLQCRR